jgi:hypothetical protein
MESGKSPVAARDGVETKAFSCESKSALKMKFKKVGKSGNSTIKLCYEAGEVK